MSSEAMGESPDAKPASSPTWTYPTRFCRICREDVAPTVTMYPPGIPPRFQTPVVEYKNDDEYGRLIKPCKCTGSMRYIHELCLQQSRVDNRRAGSLWKCHTCGYKFNFQKLAVERFLSHRSSASVLTLVFMFVLMFVLGFVADPILHLYIDPYDALLGDQNMWEEVEVQTATGAVSSWTQHLAKGFISMGLVGFLKTMLLNPWNWLNLRHYLGMAGTRTTATGRERVNNIGWVAVVIGIVSAFYFFYQWVQAVIQMSLKRFGHNIVDTQLPGDDDDLKPPPGWKPQTEPSAKASDPTDGPTENPADQAASENLEASGVMSHSEPAARNWSDQSGSPVENSVDADADSDSSTVLVESWPQISEETGRSSAVNTVHGQSWSFSGL